MYDSYFWRMSPFKRLVWLKFFAGGGSSAVEKTVKAALVHITDALARPVKKLVAEINPVQSGSGDPSPDNVRPITGFTGCEVTRTGKNLVRTKDNGRTDKEVVYTVNDDGTIKASGTATGGSSYFRTGGNPENYGTYLKAGTYKLSGGISNNKILYLIGLYVDGTGITNSTVTGGVYDRGSGLTFTLPKDAYIAYQIQISNGTEADDTFYPMIRHADDADATFAPYHGTTYSLTFPAAAGTVYGGTLTNQGSEWVLRVTDAEVDLSTLTWTSGQIGQQVPEHHVNLTDAKTVANGTAFNGIAEKYKTIRFNAVANAVYQIALRDNNNLYVTGEESPTGRLVYELATPIEYTLSYSQVVSLLAGENNIWSSTGDDVEVTYLARSSE